MIRWTAAILAALALALAAPAVVDVTDPRSVQLFAGPVVVKASERATWVVSMQGPWANATVDITIPALLADAQVSTAPEGIECQRVDSPLALYALRCGAESGPASIAIAGRVIVAPEPFCAAVVASKSGYAAQASDCQIVTGLDRLYMPIIGKGE